MSTRDSVLLCDRTLWIRKEVCKHRFFRNHTTFFASLPRSQGCAWFVICQPVKTMIHWACSVSPIGSLLRSFQWDGKTSPVKAFVSDLITGNRDWIGCLKIIDEWDTFLLISNQAHRNVVLIVGLRGIGNYASSISPSPRDLHALHFTFEVVQLLHLQA